MIVTYALRIVEEVIPSTYRESKMSSESKMWKDAMMEEINSYTRMILENYQNCTRERRRSAVSGCSQRNKVL